MAISDVERVSRDKIREALLKRSEKLAEEQHFRLRDLLRYNLKTVRAYLLRKPSSSSGITILRPGSASSSTSGAREFF